MYLIALLPAESAQRFSLRRLALDLPSESVLPAAFLAQSGSKSDDSKIAVDVSAEAETPEMQ
jgi:hypothetical protein